MMEDKITSRTNPLVVRVKRLNSRRSARRDEQAFVGEGPKLLTEALKWGGEIETVVYAQGIVLPDLPEHVRRVEVPHGLLSAMSDTETPQGVLFVCKGKQLSMPESLTGDRYLILDGVQDPGNVGTILRTADAFGADGLLLCGGCADPWSPKTIRGTMGAIFRLPIYEGNLPEAAALLAEADIPLYATALREDTRNVQDVSLKRAAVIIGSEGHGVSPEGLELCRMTLKIPMRERCESLNAAVAAAVVLWEMARI